MSFAYMIILVTTQEAWLKKKKPQKEHSKKK